MSCIAPLILLLFTAFLVAAYVRLLAACSNHAAGTVGTRLPRAVALALPAFAVIAGLTAKPAVAQGPTASSSLSISSVGGSASATVQLSPVGDSQARST